MSFLSIQLHIVLVYDVNSLDLKGSASRACETDSDLCGFDLRDRYKC